MRWNSRRFPVKFLRLAAACLLAGAAASAPAAESGFYVGLSAAAVAFDGRYDKGTYRVDASGARGAGFRTHDDADDTLYGLGAMLGHRWELTGGAWLSAEVEWLSHSGELRGRNPAACNHAPPCDWSLDHWADHWMIEPDTSRALTLRLGFRADFLAPDASLYLLAGVRRIRADFSVTYRGCGHAGTAPRPGPVACGDGDDADSLPDWWDATDRLSRNLDAWTFGAGLEQAVGERLALQAELRYTGYDREAWAPVPVVRAALSGRELGASLRLARFF